MPPSPERQTPTTRKEPPPFQASFPEPPGKPFLVVSCEFSDSYLASVSYRPSSPTKQEDIMEKLDSALKLSAGGMEA